jgi:hypothetical protein
MGVNINKRIFGSDIPKNVKQKLALRQALNQTSNFGEAITIAGDNITDENIDMNQFNFSGDGEVIADLSSRTPFARMWTAIEIRTHENYGDPKKMDAKELKELDKNPKKTYSKTNDGKIQEKDVIHNERMVYEVGNYINSEFNTGVLDRRQGDDKVFSSNDSRITSTDVIPNIFQTNSNEFMKPEAGITSITSGTEGSLGSIKKTTVNFVVHNFHDYDKIYSKYFMRPGAQIFVDFGWDTVQNLYNPIKVIDNTSDLYKDPPDGRGTNIEDILFGEFGYVTESNGDLETLIGVVTSFDSKIKANGSVECSLEIISKNAALIHGTVDTKLKNRIMYLLDAEIMNYAASHFEVMKFKTTQKQGVSGTNWGTGIGGKSGLLSKTWTTSAENINEFNDIARLFAASQLSSKGSGIGNIPSSKQTLDTSVYWQTLYGDDGKSAPGDTSNIYLSYGLFEDIILNGNFGVGSNLVNILGHKIGDGGNFESSFDSSNSFLRYEENLFNRQKEETDATKLSFLYPGTWGLGPKTYNIKYNKVPARTGTIENDKFIYDEDKPIIEAKWDEGKFGKFEKYDRENNKIPLREVFISLKVIKDGFKDKKTETISDALNYILNKINEDSYDVFDLKLGSNRQDSTKLSTLDHNLLNIKSDDDEFDKLFTFKPMSPNSIVKSYDLSITTPKNELQSMLAIQSLPSGKSIFPLSAVVDKYLAVNMTTQDNSEVGVVYLPEVGSYQSDKMESDDVLESAISFNFIDVIGGSFNEFNQVWSDDASTTFLAALDKTKSDEVSDKKGDESDITDTDFEVMNTNAKVAKSLAEYYGFLAKDNVMNEVPTVIPATLSLSIYGISSLVPGDIFKVDYLPERQRKLLYFQLTKVTHNVSSTTWTTQLETVPRIRPLDKFKSGLYNSPKSIILSRKILEQLNVLSIGTHPSYMKHIKTLPIPDSIRQIKNAFGVIVVNKMFSFIAKKSGKIEIKLPMISSKYREEAGNLNIIHNANTPIYDSFKNLDEFKIESINGKLIDTGTTVALEKFNKYQYQYTIDYKKDEMYRLIVFKNIITGAGANTLNWVIFPIKSPMTDVEIGAKLWKRMEKISSSVRGMVAVAQSFEDVMNLTPKQDWEYIKWDKRCDVCDDCGAGIGGCYPTGHPDANDNPCDPTYCTWTEASFSNSCEPKPCCNESRIDNTDLDDNIIWACDTQ